MARKPKKSEVVETGAPEALETMAPSEDNNLANDTLNSEAESSVQQSGCGNVLSATRLDQGLSTKDVAKQLRLSNTQIDALEQDDFASLPEATIVKGFIRNYAKLLKIPAEPLLNAYIQMVPAKEDYSFALNPGINMKITENKKSRKLRYFLIIAALLLGAGVWFFYQNYVQKPSPINPMPEVVEALPELALPMSERVQNASEISLEMPEQKQTVGVEPSAEELAVAGEPVVEETTDTVTAQQEGADNNEVKLIAETTITSQDVIKPEAEVDAVVSDTPTEIGKTRLTFTATQETWLSVVNTSGKEVFSKILYAGNHEVVDVRNPSEIVVGNAHGATLSVDGKAVDLAPYTRINVARVRMNRLR